MESVAPWGLINIGAIVAAASESESAVARCHRPEWLHHSGVELNL